MDKPDFPISGELLPEHMPFVYEALAERLEEEAEQRVSAQENPKNYAMTGYKYQFIVKRLNEVLGTDHWICRYRVTYNGFEDERMAGSDKKTREIVLEVLVDVGNWTHDNRIPMDGGEPVPHNAFLSLAHHRGFGGHASTTRADAYKGALTDGFKKVAAFFGVGRQAYEQTIDEAFRPETEDTGGAASKSGAAGPTTADAAHPEGSPRQSDPKHLRDALISTCTARHLNRHLVMVQAFGVMSSKDLDAEQLSSLLKGVQEDKFAICALAVGEDGEALKPKQQYVTALVCLLTKDRRLRGLPVTSSDIEETMGRLATPYERIFEKLTNPQLKEIAQKVTVSHREFQLARARIRPLANAWRDAMRAEGGDPSNEEVSKAFRHFCATQFKKEPIELTDDEMAETDDMLSANKVDVLKGEIKQVTPAEVEGQEEEPMF